MAKVNKAEIVEGWMDYLDGQGDRPRSSDDSKKVISSVEYDIKHEPSLENYFEALQIHDDKSSGLFHRCRECPTMYSDDVQALTNDLCPDCYGEIHFGKVPFPRYNVMRKDLGEESVVRDMRKRDNSVSIDILRGEDIIDLHCKILESRG